MGEGGGRKGPKRGLLWNPPFFYGWVILGVVFLTEFVGAGMGGITVSIFFKPMGDSEGWSLSQLAAAVTAQGIAGLAIAPLLGPLIDRLGARTIMLIGAFVAGGGLLALMAVQSIWQFWVLYAIVGALGMGEMGRLTGPVVVAKWFVRRRGRAMAIATSGVTIGGAVMAPIIGILINTVGWRETWAILGIVVLVVVVPVVWLFMKSRPEDLGLRPDGDRLDAGSVPAQAGPPSKDSSQEEQWTLKQALGTRSLWVLVLGMNLMGFLAAGMLYHQVQFFTTEGLSHQNATYVFTASLWGATVSRIPWGFLVERFPVRYCLATIILFRSLGALSLVVVPFPWNIGTFLVSWSVMGGSMGLVQPMVFANYYGRSFLGSIQGTMRVLLSLPQLVGPLAVALVFDATGTYTLVFSVISSLGFVAAALAWAATPPVRRSPAAAT